MCPLRLLNLKMIVNRRSWLKDGSNLRLVILVLWLVCNVGNGQTIGDTSEFNNPAVLPLVTQMVYSRLSNSTAALNRELGIRAKFCVKDPLVFLPLNYILALSNVSFSAKDFSLVLLFGLFTKIYIRHQLYLDLSIVDALIA